MMKGRSGISRSMESIRNFMNPRDNEEEHEDSKKEESKQPVIVSKNHKITSLIRTH
jgi:glutaredoxin-related protein